MNRSWEIVGTIAPGGTVLDIASDAQRQLWLASPAGLFSFAGDKWRARGRGIPFWRLNTVLAAGKLLFVAGLPAGIVRSADGGMTWHDTGIEQTGRPVTSLAASPKFDVDGVILAGTDGDGILRTTDGGRHWQLANFGLHRFDILDLATAPVWGRREYAYAATSEAVFQSPNGGRAWRALDSGLEGVRPLCLAVSPEFETNRQVFVGTEGQGLICSRDGGRHWSPVDMGGGPAVINGLWFTSAGTLLAASAEQGVWRSPDGGLTWEPGQTQLPAVLGGREVDGSQVASVLGSGLVRSTDDGCTWQPVQGIRARRFAWLAVAANGVLVTSGPEEGVWTSTDRGRTWHLARGVPVHQFIYALCGQGNRMWASTSSALFQSADGGDSWQPGPALDSDAAFLACSRHTLWAADADGRLWRLDDGEDNWHWLQRPDPAVAIVALASVSRDSGREDLILAQYVEPSQTLQLWCRDDASGTWVLWLEEPVSIPVVRMTAAARSRDEFAVGLGATILCHQAGTWNREQISSKDAPISAVLAMSEGELRMAALTGKLVASVAGQEWAAADAGLENEVVVDLVRCSDWPGDRTVWALTSDGRIARMRV